MFVLFARHDLYESCYYAHGQRLSFCRWENAWISVELSKIINKQTMIIRENVGSDTNPN